MEDLTVLYYSSNKEKPEFEDKIIENLRWASEGLPIVSITHKPINLGHNICVGDVGASGFNMFRQVLIGCKEAKTKYVISAEADCLYPPDYFNVDLKKDFPRLDVAYRNTNLYVMPDKRSYFYHKKEGATHSQIIGREFYIELLEDLFAGAPEWSVEEKNFPKERNGNNDVFDEVEFYQTENPVIQIKTGDSMRHYTHSERTPIYELPFWGLGKPLGKQYKG